VPSHTALASGADSASQVKTGRRQCDDGELTPSYLHQLASMTAERFASSLKSADCLLLAPPLQRRSSAQIPSLLVASTGSLCAGLRRVAVSACKSRSDDNARSSHAANAALIFNLDHSVEPIRTASDIEALLPWNIAKERMEH
jgi:hypothetical protein